MQGADVSRQVQQMVQFIQQEAEEKANEISVAAEEVGRQGGDLGGKENYWVLHLFAISPWSLMLPRVLVLLGVSNPCEIDRLLREGCHFYGSLASRPVWFQR